MPKFNELLLIKKNESFFLKLLNLNECILLSKSCKVDFWNLNYFFFYEWKMRLTYSAFKVKLTIIFNVALVVFFIYKIAKVYSRERRTMIEKRVFYIWLNFLNCICFLVSCRCEGEIFLKKKFDVWNVNFVFTSLTCIWAFDKLLFIDN